MLKIYGIFIYLHTLLLHSLNLRFFKNCRGGENGYSTAVVLPNNKTILSLTGERFERDLREIGERV